MIDLRKIQERFDKFFEEETEDSFNKWLLERTRKDILCMLGEGVVEELATFGYQKEKLFSPQFLFEFDNNVSNIQPQNAIAA